MSTLHFLIFTHLNYYIKLEVKAKFFLSPSSNFIWHKHKVQTTQLFKMLSLSQCKILKVLALQKVKCFGN